MYGTLLILILMNKLPMISRLFDSRAERWSVDDLMEVLRKEIEAREHLKGIA